MKRRFHTIIWLLLALAALGWLAWQTQKDPRALDAFKQALTHISLRWALAALLLYLAAQVLLAPRRLLLLRVQNVPLPFRQAVQLTFLGLFYNNVMPGAVGGDLLKAWYITYHSRPDLRLEAAVTVFVDRIIGLVGMILVAALAGFTTHISYRGFQLRYLVWAILGLMIFFLFILLSPRVRRLFYLPALARKLPFQHRLTQIDTAVRLYRRHGRIVLAALALTALVQGLAIVAVWTLTQAFQFHQVRFAQCLVIMPLIWAVSAAIPIPGGLGVIEGLITYLFAVVIDPTQPQGMETLARATAFALAFRLLLCITSLPGALVPLFGGHLPKPRDLAHPPDPTHIPSGEKL